MKEKLGCAAAIVYFGMGLVQVLATITGVQLWTGWPWMVAAFVSFLVGYIPIVGTIAGIKGATDAWGWQLWSAIAFFCWPYALYIVGIAVGGVAELFSRRREK